MSKEKVEEAYFHRLLLLYYPWRIEEQLKTHNSYKVSFEIIQQQVIPKIQEFESFHEDVETLLDDFDPDDLSPEIWEEVMQPIEQEKEGAVQDAPSYAF